MSSEVNSIGSNNLQSQALTTNRSDFLSSLNSIRPVIKTGIELERSIEETFGSKGKKAGTLSQIMSGIKLVNQLAPFLRDQVKLDIGSGKGLFAGASEFGGQVGNALQLYQQFKDVRGVEDVGAIGQNLVLTQFKQELMSTAAKQFGLNTADLSLEKVGEMAWNYVTTGSINSAGAVATEVGQAGTALASDAGGVAGAASESGMLSTGGKILGAAGAAYAAYGLVKGWGNSSPKMGAVQGATVGAYVGSVIPGVGTVIGGVIGAAVGGIMGCIHTGKSKDQKARDAVRKGLQQVGFVDENWKIRLADGSGYDIGKDGKHKLNNMDGSTRRAYEVDFSNPLAGQVVAMVTPVVQQFCGGNEKLTNQFTGYLTNAALSNAQDLKTAQANVMTFMSNLRIQ